MVGANSKTASIAGLARTFADAKLAWQAANRGMPVNAYRAARQTRWTPTLSGIPSGSSADYHYQSEYDYFYMVEAARELDRDDIFAAPCINRLVDNVMQNGFTYDPQTGSEAADAILKERFRLFCDSRDECDVQGEQPFAPMAGLVLRHSLVDGDVFALLTSMGAIQVLENHRVRTPYGLSTAEREYTIHGVRLDANRKRLGYYVTKDDIALGEFPRYDQAQFVPVFDEVGQRQMLHIYHPRRITQTRGVTKYANCTDAVRMHDDIQFAKLVQQQGVSVWSMIRERELGFELPEDVQEDVDIVQDPCRPGETRAIRNVSAGMWYTGYPGEKVKGFSPNVPNPTFFSHTHEVRSLIALNIDLPLILAMMDASETNFSGWRGALEQAKLSFRRFQRWFASTFHTPVLQWKLTQWSDPTSPYADPAIVAMRRAGVDVFAHQWVFPSWPYIQPLEDASADLLEVRNALSSQRRVQAKRGLDWETVSSEIIQDNAILIRKAKQMAVAINAEYADDEPVTWRDLATLPTPDGVSISVSRQPGAEPSTNATVPA